MRHLLKIENLKFQISFFALLLFLLAAKNVDAATFQMQTGYYVGTGVTGKTVTGVGFQPELLFIRRSTDTFAASFKTSAMTAANTSFFDAGSDNTGTSVTLDADGFTIDSTGTAWNTLSNIYFWVAFRGSDCTSSGTFCVGSYTGNGIAGNAITSVGFQPDLVWVKKSVSTGGGGQNVVWRSSAMGANESNIFVNVNSTTTAITSLDATGFTVGVSTTANENTRTYWYVAFKQINGFMDVGTYTGTGSTSAQVIDYADDAGMNFKPNWVFVKNSNSTTAQQGVFNILESHGNYSTLFAGVDSVTNEITGLLQKGFSVGTGMKTNGNNDTMYYAAFGGAPERHLGSGTFKMQTGTYAGSGATTSITGVGFAPDLVIIKHQDQATDQYAVWSTSLNTDRSFRPASNVSPGSHAGSIISLDSDGFTIGGNIAVNASGDTFYWVAFGNANRPDRPASSRSADFYLGAYRGMSTLDNRDIITRNSFTPALVAISSLVSGSNGPGRWRTATATQIDLSMPFRNDAPDANMIQSLFPGGFQVGTASNVNGDISFWFAFAAGPYFQAGSYRGDGVDSRNIFEKFKPDYMWIKRASSAATVQGTVFTTRDAAQGDLTFPFMDSAAFANGIQNFIFNGFQLGTDATVNQSGFQYEYAAWKIQQTGIRLRGTIRLRSTHRLR